MTEDINENSLNDFINQMKRLRVINGIGTMTSLGGNVISNDVIESMKHISNIFINMDDLSKLAGDYISKRLDVEAAYITSGASSGIVLGLSALLSIKFGIKYIQQIIDKGQTQFVAVQRPHKTEFTDLITLVGPQILEFGNEKIVTKESLIDTLVRMRGKVLAIVHFMFEPMNGTLPLENVLEIAHSFDVPVIVDAAAELPPKENLTKYYRMGSDIVLFSGGKMMGGFSNSGLMIGKKHIIDAVSKIGPLSEELTLKGSKIFIGRPMKISKELIVATLVALENFLKFDEDTWMDEIYNRAKYIQREISHIDRNLTAKVVYPLWNHPRPSNIPRVEIKFKDGKSAREVSLSLKKYKIPIYTYFDGNKLYINPQCLTDEDISTLMEGVSKVLKSTKRKKDDRT